MRIYLHAVFCAVALLCAEVVLAQDQTIQMRPDEAFWNAIRDSAGPEPFELFLSTHPESPYAAEAKAKLDGLKQEAASTPAVPAVATAAPASSPVAPAAPGKPAAASAHAGASPGQEDLDRMMIEALRKFGFLDSDKSDLTAYDDEVQTALVKYQGMMQADYVTSPEPEQILELAELAEIAVVVREFGYEGGIVPAALQRAQTVYEQLAGGSGKPDRPALFSALQRHFGLPETGEFDAELLRLIAGAEFTETYETQKEYVEFGDWLFSYRDNPMMRGCWLYYRPDKLESRGMYLSSMPAAPVFIHYMRDDPDTLTALIAPGDLFDEDEPVYLQLGKQRVQLKLIHGTYDAYIEPQTADGFASGKDILMFIRAPDKVSLVGTSPLGGDLVFHYSAKGFTKAFKTMSDRCSGGKLDIWMR